MMMSAYVCSVTPEGYGEGYAHPNPGSVRVVLRGCMATFCLSFKSRGNSAASGKGLYFHG